MAKKDSSLDKILTNIEVLGTLISGGIEDTKVDRSVKQSVNDLNQRFQKNIGRSLSPSTISAIDMIQQDTSADAKSTVNDSTVEYERRKKAVEITKLVAGIDDPNIFNLFELEERDRFIRYADARGVSQLMPELVTTFEIYNSAIVSPDDFNGHKSFSVDYLGYDPDNIHVDNAVIVKDKNKLDDMVKYAISESIMIGDSFILNIPMEKALRVVAAHLPDLQPLDESAGSKIDIDAVVKNLIENIKRSYIDSSDSIEDFDYRDFIYREDYRYESELMPRLDEYLNESGAYGAELVNVDTQESQRLPPIYENSDEFLRDFNSVVSKYLVIDRDAVDYVTMQCIENGSLDKNIRSVLTREKNNLGNTSRGARRQSLLTPEDTLPGSLIKHLPPTRVIKLYSSGRVHGYLYYEEDLLGNMRGSLSDMPSVYSSGGIDVAGTARLRSLLGRTGGTRSDENANSSMKSKFLVDMFGSVLSRRVDKTKLMSNPDYAKFVQNILSDYVLQNKRVRVTFFEAEEVVHFAPNLNPIDGYGRPITNMVLFYCKLIVGLVTNALVWNIKRNRETNAWYVDMGLEDNDQEVVMNLARDIKSRDISLSSFASLGNTLTTAGAMNDWIIPVYDGKKPVERESLPVGSGDRTMNNEFIEYLVKAVLSAVVIPPAVAGIDDVEFARALAMQHGRFLRKVALLQSDFIEPASALLRLAYLHEYQPGRWKQSYLNMSRNTLDYLADTEVRSYIMGLIGSSKPKEFKVDDEKKANEINISLLFMRFTQPSGLNVQIMNDALQNVVAFCDQLKILYLGENTEDETLGVIFKRGLVKFHMPGLPWDKYDKILEDSKSISNIIANERSKDDENEDKEDGYIDDGE
jgi:hypothetical protein